MAITTRPDVEIEGLSDVEATINFTNPEDFTRTFQALYYKAHNDDRVSDHTFLVTGFPEIHLTIDDDDDNSNQSIPQQRKLVYFHTSQTLIITMKSAPHEVAAIQFHSFMVKRVIEMGCFDELVPTGGATVSMHGVTKEPDMSWGPSQAGPDYRTCVLESAVSESNQSLTFDANIWLEHPESHVTQVVTVKICRGRPEITFKVWTTHQEQQNRPRAVVDQEVQITLKDGRPIADGMLSLSFEKIFERQPQPGTAERDFTFSARELGGLARLVWLRMGIKIE